MLISIQADNYSGLIGTNNAQRRCTRTELKRIFLSLLFVLPLYWRAIPDLSFTTWMFEINENKKLNAEIFQLWIITMSYPEFLCDGWNGCKCVLQLLNSHVYYYHYYYRYDSCKKICHYYYIQCTTKISFNKYILLRYKMS